MILRKIEQKDIPELYIKYYTSERGQFAPDDFCLGIDFQHEFDRTGFYSDTYKALIAVRTEQIVGIGFLFTVEDRVELGTFAFESGKGLGTGITKALLEYGFSRLHFVTIWVCPNSQNLASIKMITKCGFQSKGNDMYSITKEQWEHMQ